MINPNSHKTSFDIRLPHDPQNKYNKLITKGYSTSLCLVNISIKVGISIGILIILLFQLNPQEVINKNITEFVTQKFFYGINYLFKVFKDKVKFREIKN